jgi:hypothetical protein
VDPEKSTLTEGNQDSARDGASQEVRPNFKCPKCGSTQLSNSRRKNSFEEWSALWGTGYFRCKGCHARFGLFTGFGESESYYTKVLTVRKALGRLALLVGLVAVIVVLVMSLNNGISLGLRSTK